MTEYQRLNKKCEELDDHIQDLMENGKKKIGLRYETKGFSVDAVIELDDLYTQSLSKNITVGYYGNDYGTIMSVVDIKIDGDNVTLALEEGGTATLYEPE